MADWFGLPRELLVLIARRLTQVSDHLAFSWVCSSWRSIALEIRSDFPPPLPGLMIPTPHDSDLETCSFFSLSKNKVQKLNLPVQYNERCIGSSGGWLVTVATDLKMHIYNPFCKVRFLLPSLRRTLSKKNRNANNYRLVQVAAMSSSNPENSVVMVSHTGIKRLAFARPGDDSWTLIEEIYSHYDDVIFYKGQFYAVSHTEIVVCDIGPSPKVTLVAKHGSDACSKRYLVESAGELLLVERSINWDEWDGGWDDYDNDDPFPGIVPYKTISISVYKLDMSKHEWCRLQSLGGRTLFLGFNTSYSLLASDYTRCRRDCIYFTDDYIAEGGGYILRGRDMGIFNLEDGSVNHLYTNNSNKIMPMPTWVIPLPW